MDRVGHRKSLKHTQSSGGGVGSKYMCSGKERVRAQVSMGEGKVIWRKTILDHDHQMSKP